MIAPRCSQCVVLAVRSTRKTILLTRFLEVVRGGAVAFGRYKAVVRKDNHHCRAAGRPVWWTLRIKWTAGSFVANVHFFWHL